MTVAFQRADRNSTAPDLKRCGERKQLADAHAAPSEGLHENYAVLQKLCRRREQASPFVVVEILLGSIRSAEDELLSVSPRIHPRPPIGGNRNRVALSLRCAIVGPSQSTVSEASLNCLQLIADRFSR